MTRSKWGFVNLKAHLAQKPARELRSKAIVRQSVGRPTDRANAAFGTTVFRRAVPLDYCLDRLRASHLRWVGKMLIAAFIFVISMAAMVQFAVLSWRAGLLRLAANPLPGEADSVAAQALDLLRSQDFRGLSALQQMCPDLSGSKAPSLRSVSLYYRVLRSLNALSNAILPTASTTGWAQSEMALCARYATVVLSQRLERNRALIAEVRSH